MLNLNMIIVYISVILILLIIIPAVIYNCIVSLKTRVNEAWSGIDVQLKKRYDLIPKLVEAVDKFAEFEKSLLTGVTELRTRAMNNPSVESQGALNKELTPQINSIFVTVEKYPEVKTSENIINLQNQLVAVEETIQYARKYYNGTVRNYNISIKTFPNSIIASLFRFAPAEYFQADEAAQKDISL